MCAYRETRTEVFAAAWVLVAKSGKQSTRNGVGLYARTWSPRHIVQRGKKSC